MDKLMFMKLFCSIWRRDKLDQKAENGSKYKLSLFSFWIVKEY